MSLRLPTAAALCLLVSALASHGAVAAQTGPPPAAPQDSAFEAKVRETASSLRCPVCQNLSVQDSHSELAQDMKRLIRQRLAAGETPEQVRRYFVARYGEWVLLAPKPVGVNLTVWLLPALALVGGGVLVWRAVRRWVKQGGEPERAPVGASEEARPAAETALQLRARKESILAARDELEADFAAGKMAPADYEVLKQRDEAELAAVTAALKQLKKTGGATPPQPGGKVGETAAQPPRRRIHPALAWGAGLAGFGLVVAVTLRGALGPREPGGVMTGFDPAAGQGPAAPVEPVDSSRLAALEARVARDSNDSPTLIELGHLYLAQQRFNRSAQVNMRAVRLRPDAPETAEAFAHLGMILWSAGEIAAGLRSLDKALALHRDLPEALLYKGIILFAGAQDPRGAAAAWERYLEVAPPDAETARVRAMLEAARRAGAGASQ